MNDNQRLALSLTLRQHWPALLAVLALLLCAFLWQRGENALAEADTLRARVNLAATLADEQKRFEEIQARVTAAKARLAEIETREAEVYPEIERRRAEVGKLQSKIRLRQSELARLEIFQIGPPRPAVALTDQELVKAFGALGYTVTPVTDVTP